MSIMLTHLTSKVFGVEGLSNNAVEYTATASSGFAAFTASSPVISSVVMHWFVNSEVGIEYFILIRDAETYWKASP